MIHERIYFKQLEACYNMIFIHVSFVFTSKFMIHAWFAVASRFHIIDYGVDYR